MVTYLPAKHLVQVKDELRNVGLAGGIDFRHILYASGVVRVVLAIWRAGFGYKSERILLVVNLSARVFKKCGVCLNLSDPAN